jgi:hypothetical protein
LTPALASWLLAVPYVLTAVGFLFVAWAAGGFAYLFLFDRTSNSEMSGWCNDILDPGLLLVLIRTAAGLALISWVGAILGLLGFFDLPALIALLLPIVVGGAVAANKFAPSHRPHLIREWIKLRHYFLSSTLIGKLFFLGLIIMFFLISLNAVIGALVPDMNHDPMWYHLPLPQQWVYDEKFTVYPSALQSAYPLAAESLFAIVFAAGGDVVLCSLLVAVCGLCFLSTLVTSAWASISTSESKSLNSLWGIGAVMGLCVPLMVPYVLIAPIQPKNDPVMLFWACTGTMILYVPLLGFKHVPTVGSWAVGGFLLGTAICAKPTVLNMIFFFFVFIVPLAFVTARLNRQKWVQLVVANVTVCVGAVLLAAMPWLLRGYLAHGVPLYPVGTSLFPLSASFLPLHNSLGKIQAVPGVGLEEWKGKVLRLGPRLLLGAQHGEKMVFIYLIAASLGLIVARGRWRWLAGTLFFHLTLIIGFEGAVEVFRFFAPSYCLAIPLVGLLVARGVSYLNSFLRFAVAGLVCLAAVGSLLEVQLRIAGMKTMSWKFRPVLSHEDVKEYSTHAEMGPLAADLKLVANHIGKEERVFLLGATYPFYLHRDTLWNDEVVKAGGVVDRWNAMTAVEAAAFLKQQRIDVVLHASGIDKVADGPVDELIAQERILVPVLLPEKLERKGWTLYRVR